MTGRRQVDDTLRLLVPVLDAAEAGGTGGGGGELAAALGGFADLDLDEAEPEAEPEARPEARPELGSLNEEAESGRRGRSHQH